MHRGFTSLDIILLLVIGLAAFGGAGWYVSQRDGVATHSGEMASTTEDTAVKTALPVSVTTSTGVHVMLRVSSCEHQDKLLCFGSGATLYDSQDGVTAFDLVSKDCQPSYGIIVPRGGKEAYYEVVVDNLGAACNQKDIYTKLHTQVFFLP